MLDEKAATLLAMCVGDGYLRGRKLRLCHGQKQARYLAWKTEVINSILGTNYAPCRINNNGYIGYVVDFCNDAFELLEPTLSKGKWSSDVINELSPLGLAIVWMDDGCLAVKQRNGVRHGMEGFLSTYLPYLDNENTVRALNGRFGLAFTSVKDRKHYRCRTGLKGLRTLRSIVEPYIHDDLRYKIDLSRQSNDLVARGLVYSDKFSIRGHEAATP